MPIHTHIQCEWEEEKNVPLLLCQYLMRRQHILTNVDYTIKTDLSQQKKGGVVPVTQLKLCSVPLQVYSSDFCVTLLPSHGHLLQLSQTNCVHVLEPMSAVEDY